MESSFTANSRPGIEFASGGLFVKNLEDVSVDQEGEAIVVKVSVNLPQPLYSPYHQIPHLGRARVTYTSFPTLRCPSMYHLALWIGLFEVIKQIPNALRG